MQNSKTKLFFLILVLLFGLVLFTFRLGSIPAGTYADEAVVGYDALSIANTYRDHYGKLFPIHFRFFNTYSPGLYVYTIALLLKFFDLSTFVIRLPSAISILIVGLGIFYFFSKYKILKLKYSSVLVVLMFFLTPYTVFNARLGYETTFAFALFSLGVLFYEKPRISFALLSLSTYAGFTERYLAPLTILVIYFVFYYKNIPLKRLFWPVVLALLIQVPNIILMFTPSFWIKNSSLNPSFFEHYFSYFSPFNLFMRPDFDLQRSIPKLSVFYPWMFIPLVSGLYAMYRGVNKRITLYILLLLLTSPLPASLANTNFSTQRALPLLLPYILIIGIGIDKILQNAKDKIKILLVVFAIFISGVLLWRSYFILFPVERAVAWNYGYDQLAKKIKNNPQYQFLIDDARGIPYILILYWLEYPPSVFQKENPTSGAYYWDLKFKEQISFSNVQVRSIIWEQDICKNQILVGDNLAISLNQIEEHHLEHVFDIRDPNQNIVLQAYSTHPEIKCLDTTKK